MSDWGCRVKIAGDFVQKWHLAQELTNSAQVCIRRFCGRNLCSIWTIIREGDEMTTINDIQDLVQIMEERPEWRRELQRVLLTPDLRDTASLIRETAKLVAKNAESIDKLDTSTKRLTEMAGLHSGHIGDMRGLFISLKVVREAALIADDMGLTFVGTLEPEDILNIWNAGKSKGLTDAISKEDERSFKSADLIIEAKADDGAQCFIAVEISFTVDERDTRRAIRNAAYITSFIEAPAYAAVAGVSKDNRIDGVLADTPEPHESEQETRVFWSQHEEIEKPN